MEKALNQKTTNELLKLFRLRRGLNQTEAAVLLQTSNNYVCNTETGQRHGSPKYLANFAKVFKLTKEEKALLLDSALIK